MRLSNFILSNLETILQEWEDFAASLLLNGQYVGKIALRDHVKKILENIAADIAQPESEHDEIEKSKGHNNLPESQTTAATTHGKERLALGFSLDAALAEYRALRASVIRLWEKSIRDQPVSDDMIDDLIRFNESIDQCINESVSSYSFEKEQQTRVFDTILSALPNLIFTFTLDNRFSYVNKALSDLLAVPAADLIGKTFVDAGFPTGADLQLQLSNVVGTKKQCRGELSYTGSNGKLKYFAYVFVPAIDKEGMVEAVAGTAHDITERKKVEDRNWRQANFDQLTGLPNRRLFLDRLEQEVSHARRTGTHTALLFIDLDHFKEVNDQFGHDTGDQLLRLVTDRLKLCVRATDTVARLGGDEFTIILQDLADTGYVEFVAEKILSDLSAPFQVFDGVVHISASIGITVCPVDALTPEALLTCADQAMYLAKNAGRNQFRLYAEGQVEKMA